jgi:hypothetical protein
LFSNNACEPFHVFVYHIATLANAMMAVHPVTAIL